ncbi:hypothetical protein [Thiorhodovibrio litoralis]|nr:hypothetical protein [Thiorhodovibrio litoralis]
MQRGCAFFLSHPRRFGTSLLVDTRMVPWISLP